MKQDPRVRRAHYFLGMGILDEKGKVGIEEAIPHFQAELELAPDDPAANLELGVALVETPASGGSRGRARRGRPFPSRPPHARSTTWAAHSSAAGRPAEAVAPLRRALELSGEQGGKPQALRGTHIQLGQALRALGQTEEAATHFAEAARLSGQEADEARDGLARHLSDSPGPPSAATPVAVIESTPSRGAARRGAPGADGPGEGGAHPRVPEPGSDRGASGSASRRRRT